MSGHTSVLWEPSRNISSASQFFTIAWSINSTFKIVIYINMATYSLYNVYYVNYVYLNYTKYYQHIINVANESLHGLVNKQPRHQFTHQCTHQFTHQFTTFVIILIHPFNVIYVLIYVILIISYTSIHTLN